MHEANIAIAERHNETTKKVEGAEAILKVVEAKADAERAASATAERTG